MRLLKSFGKWVLILAVVAVGMTYLTGLDFETRVGWFIGGLALAIAYLDGSMKDRIADLEYRIDRLDRQLNGR